MSTHRIFFATVDGDDNHTVIWEAYLNNLELLAGMLAAGLGIMDDINATSTTLYYYVDSDADVSHFRLLNDVPEDATRYNSLDGLEETQYGIWLKGSKRFYYNLYAFQTNAFFQGIVSMANAFGVDFRNYIYGFPFDTLGKQYSLSGYVMAPYQVAVDPFDLDDIEEEEEDNENILNPFERTGDIITIRYGEVVTPP